MSGLIDARMKLFADHSTGCTQHLQREGRTAPAFSGRDSSVPGLRGHGVTDMGPL